MEVIKNIYQIKSESPFRYPMNTYFIDDEKSCLIDTSAEEVPRTLIKGLEAIGRSLVDINYVLISHVHYEHVRSLAYIKEHAPNCRVLASPRNADYLMNFEKYTKLVFQKYREELHAIPGLYEFYHPLFTPIKSIQNVEVIKEGDLISLGNHTLEVIETSGHCTEEISFYCQQNHILFSSDFIIGDAIETWIATIPVIYDYNGDRKKYLANLQKIANMKERFDLIYPAHGAIISNPKEKIESLLSIKSKAPNRILKILGSGPKTLIELVEHFFGKKYEKTRKFYNSSRMIRALLNYLLEEGRITKKDNHYFII